MPPPAGNPAWSSDPHCSQPWWLGRARLLPLRDLLFPLRFLKGSGAPSDYLDPCTTSWLSGQWPCPLNACMGSKVQAARVLSQLLLVLFVLQRVQCAACFLNNNSFVGVDLYVNYGEASQIWGKTKRASLAQATAPGENRSKNLATELSRGPAGSTATGVECHTGPGGTSLRVGASSPCQSNPGDVAALGLRMWKKEQGQRSLLRNVWTPMVGGYVEHGPVQSANLPDVPGGGRRHTMEARTEFVEPRCSRPQCLKKEAQAKRGRKGQGSTAGPGKTCSAPAAEATRTNITGDTIYRCSRSSSICAIACGTATWLTAYCPSIATWQLAPRGCDSLGGHSIVQCGTGGEGPTQGRATAAKSKARACQTPNA